MNAELQHGHTISVWEQRGARGAAASKRALQARVQCPKCGEWWRSLAKHIDSCEGKTEKTSDHICPGCGGRKSIWVPTCTLCTGDGLKVEEEIARSRGIPLEEVQRLVGSRRYRPEQLSLLEGESE